MGLIGGMARTAVIAGTATAVGNRVSRRQANRWAQHDQSNYPPQYAQPQYAQPVYAQPPPPYSAPPPAPVQYTAPAPAAAPPAAPDMYEQLKRLGEFRDQGILTEEEFALQKSRILSA
jgi:hypothetical protein